MQIFSRFTLNSYLCLYWYF